VTPQSLPIPQTQVPSAASSFLCPKRTQKASEAEAESGFTGLTMTLRRGISNRVFLCLGYPVHRSLPPTRRPSSDGSLVPGEAWDKLLNPHATWSLLRATRIASEGFRPRF
jgi:hypothetical protein